MVYIKTTVKNNIIVCSVEAEKKLWMVCGLHRKIRPTQLCFELSWVWQLLKISVVYENKFRGIGDWCNLIGGWCLK